MKRRRGALARGFVIGLCLAAGASSPLAQGRGGGGPPPGGGGPGGGGMGGPGFPNGGPGGPGGMPPQSGQRGQLTENRASVQLGPPGRWWDDRGFARNLKLRPDQQTRMDAIFEQNRNTLLSRLEGVRQAESQMEELRRSPSLDEAALFTQIDRVAQARAELEKANTHLLLQLRKEMDADQIGRLEKSLQK
jgi:Spy/CpxP family protein refolding chaperone